MLLSQNAQSEEKVILSRCTIFSLSPNDLHSSSLQLSSFSSTYSLLSPQITMSSANIMVHGASSLISSVILSITIANKQVLKADPWCSPTFTSNPSVTPTAHLTAVVLSSYIILYYSYILLCQSRLSHAIPHLFSWHLVISFLQLHKPTM